VERVDLTREHGKDRRAEWRHGWEHGPFVTVISIGLLADGRWFAERHGRGASRRDLREGACVYAGPRAEHLGARDGQAVDADGRRRVGRGLAVLGQDVVCTNP
jgi:hypothetical protein